MQYSQSALQQVREGRLLISEVDQWLFDVISRYLGQRVLEIGCGLGNLALHMTDREFYMGVDVSEESIVKNRDAFAEHSSMQFCVADVTDRDFVNLGRYDPDTVVSLNTLEHIEDDLLAMQNMSKVLRSGGVVITVVPAHDFAYGSMDRAIGHYRRYSIKRMDDLASQAGLTCIARKHVNVLGCLGWFVNGRLLRQEVPPSGQLRIFNRLAPLLRRIENVIDVPLGVSLVTVARKDVST